MNYLLKCLFKSPYFIIRKKFFRIMRLLIICFSVCLCQLSATVYSQNGLLTVETKKTTLRELFLNIEQQSNYRFFYNDVLTNIDKEVSISAQSKSIDEVLDMILANSGVTYRILDNQLIVISPVALLQAITITGKVTDETGSTLPGVNVIIKGTNTGTVTDANGNYSIAVPNQETTLVFSFLGFLSQDIVVFDRRIIDVILMEDLQQLEEVVVTAMGILKEKKGLGYSVQDIGADELMKNKTANPISSLAGKIAGVNITQTSGAPGSGAQIILRGGKSLERDNQPIFVVDGIIYDNSTSVNGNSGFDGMQSVATTNSNRVMDINPEDIENMSILKGPAAAALYGSRAAAGVIIITTKKGQEGVATVNFSSKYTRGWINRLPEEQEKYKRGVYDVNGALNDYTTQSWGEAFTSNEKNYNNMKDFFQASNIFDNTLSLATGNKNGTTYLSASHYDQQGIVPSTGYNKLTFRLNTDQKIGILTMGANMAYSTSKTEKTLTSAGLWGTSGNGAMESVYRWSRNDDMKKYLNDDGTKYRMFEGLQPLQDDIENPYWTINKNKMNDHTDRFTGTGNINVRIADWWNLSYRAGIDTYTTNNYNLIYPGSAIQVLWQEGMMSENETKYRYLSSNLMSNFNYAVSDFDFNLLLGTSAEDYKWDVNRRMGYKFSVPDFFSFSNIIDLNKRFDRSTRQKRMVSVYGEFRASWKSTLYLTVTGRNDKSSTLYSPLLGDKNASYFYPSVSGSFVFTQLLPKSDILSFGKVRASWARVGKDADAYVTNTYLWSARTHLGDIIATGNDWSRGNPYLKPETTISTELGFDLKLYNGRVGLEYTYYTDNSYNQILSPRLGQTTGYIFCSVNAGDIYNKGMELTLTGQPVKTRDFTWEATINIAGNRGTVDNLLTGVEILYVTDVQVGNAKAASFNKGNFMAISGSKYNRPGDVVKNLKLTNEDEVLKQLGDMKDMTVLDSSGRPTSDNLTTYEIGNREPRFTGGFNNSFQYKNWNLSFLFDFRKGGHIYNGTEFYMTQVGRSARTLNRESITIKGVEQTGTIDGTGLNANGEQINVKIPVYQKTEKTFNANSKYDIGGTQTDGRNIIMQYYSSYLARESANFMVDTWWVRLRAISLNYSLPQSLLSKTQVIKAGNITVSGHNLFLLTNYKGMDPEVSAAGSGVIGSSSVGIDYLGVPATAGVSVGINLTF